MAPTPLSFGAWAMLTIFSVILYGGALYYTAIAMKMDLAAIIDRLGLRIVTRTWKRGPEGRVAVIAGTIVFLLLVEAIFVGVGGGPEEPNGGPQGRWVRMGETTVVTGYTPEGQSDEATPDLGDLRLVAANLTLAWNDNDVDEPIQPGPIGLAPRNRPDTFRLTVRLLDGTELTREGTSDPDSRLGEIRLQVPEPEEGDISDWIVDVECVQAGDVTGALGRVWAQDGGNDWSLRIEYTYMMWEEPAGGSE